MSIIIEWPRRFGKSTLRELYRQEFEATYSCTFISDPVMPAIIDRLQQYYDATPDSVDNRTAARLYREFIEWARNSGYKPEDIVSAKMACQY